MTRPRKQQISLDATPFYHCTSRCVRRAFLCGKDKASGVSYEHRRQQIQDDMLRLASIFFIDIAAFAVMSNHYHIVLHVDRPASKEASAKSVVRRWHRLFKGSQASQKYINNETLGPQELAQVDVLIETWRNRLYDISWFMKVLNENISRRANKEDECTGHFWEARFTSQALLDERAVLSCMSYIDLNPIRALMAQTPETSDYTSIKTRIDYWKNKASDNGINPADDYYEDLQPKSLLPFAGNLRQPMPRGIHFNLIDYIQLVDWTGRCVRKDKRGAIDGDIPPALARLNISAEHWIELATNFEGRFKGIAGSVQSIKTLCAKFGLSRQINRSNSKLLYG